MKARIRDKNDEVVWEGEYSDFPEQDEATNKWGTPLAGDIQVGDEEHPEWQLYVEIAKDGTIRDPN